MGPSTCSGEALPSHPPPLEFEKKVFEYLMYYCYWKNSGIIPIFLA